MSSDLDKWFEMCETAALKVSQDTRRHIESFAQLEDALFYVTTIQDSVIGGTALFRDRKRLGMALASVVITEEYRERLLRNLIKSSLPFFRTAAIRDVDALVASEDFPFPQFPISFILPEWTRPTLEALEFSSVERLLYVVVQGPFNRPSQSINWDKTIDEPAAQSLVWDQRHYTGFDSSHVWLSLYLGIGDGTVRSISQDGDVVLVLVYSLVERDLVVQLLVWDGDRIDDSFVVDALLQLANELDVESLHIHIRERKSKILNALVQSPDDHIRHHKIEIYRKLL